MSRAVAGVLPCDPLDTPPLQRLADALLSTEPMLRARLQRAGLAMLLLAAAVLAMGYFAWSGVAAAGPLAAWAAATLGGIVLFFLLLRGGWARRRSDPTLTAPQMVFALTSAATVYALLGAARGAVFPVVMVVLMSGMFVASPRQMRAVSLYAVALFGVVMAAKALTDPTAYPPVVEIGHFLLLATMLPAVSVLAGRLSRLRHRARLQRGELTQALARLREQNIRDEVTGLVNRRHMETLLAQEHQRCTRSGQTFCLALLDIDRFKPVNEAHGYAAGDAVLRALAGEAQRHVRASDMLARWGGGSFLLLMPDSRAALASAGVERLQQRLRALRTVHGGAEITVALSVGMVEHLAGEAVTQTLERAARALADAKAQGDGRVAVAA